MKRYIIAALFFIPFAVQAQNPTSSMNDVGSASDISGNYICSGTKPDGNSFQNASLKITKNNDIYQSIWTGSETGKGVGVGVAIADSNNTVVFAFKSSKDVGLGIYKLQADGSLQCTFIFKDNPNKGTGTCVKSGIKTHT